MKPLLYAARDRLAYLIYLAYLIVIWLLRA